MRTVPVLSAAACWLVAITVTVGQDRQPPVKPKEAPTAWGKPIDGLQAGLRVKPTDPFPGSIVDLQVVVRNVGQKRANFRYEPALYFRGEDDSGVIVARSAFAYGGFAARGLYLEPELAPGDEYAVGRMTIFRPSPEASSDLMKRTRLHPGTYRVGMDRVELQLSGRKTVELGTGYLDVTIPPEKK
jgi:hypothetical protein